MFGRPTLFVVLVTAMFAGYTSAQDVDEARVVRFLTALTADEMAGREAGTEGERKAAALIAQAYKDAGLSFFNSMNSYFQKFTRKRFSISQLDLKINGKVIEQCAISMESERLEMTDPHKLAVFWPDPDQPFFPSLGPFIKHQGPKLLLLRPPLAPEHQKIFEYIGRSGMVAEPDPNHIIVVAVCEATEVRSLQLTARAKRKVIEMANLVGLLKGKTKPDEYVLFSAHYDHIGMLESVDGDRIANGADDDGSGTAAVVELAHYFASRGNNARSLLFVAFTAEELGGFGSKYMATQIDVSQFVAGINIEMIGKRSKFGSGQGFITGYDKSSLPTIMAQELEGKPYALHPDPYPKQRLFLRSDNASFAKLGIPAHTVGSSQIDQDPYYHTVHDEIGTLDSDHMNNMIRAIALASMPFVDGTQTPTRITPDWLE